ncbi:hypothetical protein HYH02_014020 [Chlamydomonas schloesseri]|uniref:Uncharacterized protein n=1 Tax=Chlamydomonas schloesseri TaxID=2026947 RepID=A0A835SM18_9CHLO|nr:hypothetical protein HYH02_014020 [Chlamydomonas schloesseri]|eukprot:KAG2429682.1 hypothetical protein HYH02_014020 [Chlamydomonas schloesseri]
MNRTNPLAEVPDHFKEMFTTEQLGLLQEILGVNQCTFAQLQRVLERRVEQDGPDLAGQWLSKNNNDLPAIFADEVINVVAKNAVAEWRFKRSDNKPSKVAGGGNGGVVKKEDDISDIPEKRGGGDDRAQEQQDGVDQGDDGHELALLVRGSSRNNASRPDARKRKPTAKLIEGLQTTTKKPKAAILTAINHSTAPNSGKAGGKENMPGSKAGGKENMPGGKVGK